MKNIPTKNATLHEIIKDVLSGISDSNVVVGPLCWREEESCKFWYFVENECGFRADQIVVKDDADKAAVIAELLISKPPLVVHTTDDEVYMARLCEALWPSAAMTRLRAAVEAELGAA